MPKHHIAEDGFSVALSTWDTNNCNELNHAGAYVPSTNPLPEQYERRGPLRQRQRRLSEAQVGDMAHRYKQGATVYELAAEFGCNRTTVAERLKRIGLELRGSRRIDQVDLDSRP